MLIIQSAIIVEKDLSFEFTENLTENLVETFRSKTSKAKKGKNLE